MVGSSRRSDRNNEHRFQEQILIFSHLYKTGGTTKDGIFFRDHRPRGNQILELAFTNANDDWLAAHRAELDRTIT